MTEAPKAKNGASEMIFCLSRASVGKYFAKAGRPSNDSGFAHFKDYQEAELVISKAENEVEETFIRYCDVINLLHFLTLCSIRSGITAMRLRIRLPKIRNQTVTDEEKRNTFQLARKILDTDSAVCANASLTKYRWLTRPLFANSRTRAIGLGQDVRNHIRPLDMWAAFFSVEEDILQGSKLGISYSAVGGRAVGIGPDPSGPNQATLINFHPPNNPSMQKFREASKQGEAALKSSRASPHFGLVQ